MTAGIRRLLWPGLMTAVMLVILLGLGTWQMQRRAWKAGVLLAIEAAEAGPTNPLSEHPAPFSKVVAEGSIPTQSPTARYGAELRRNQMGAHLIVPLRLADGRTILADLGWLPDATTAAPPAGPIRVEGFIRPGEAAGWSSATDNLATRRFYTLDPGKIGLALGQHAVAPFALVALGPTSTPGQPEPAMKMPRPPNDHLSYALTWYGLAAVLAVIFLVHARKVLRP